MDAELQARIDHVAATYSVGKPSAVKRGRNSEWPYVAILTDWCGVEGMTHNPMGRRAYATREEAIQAATRYIAVCRASMKARLMEPRMRALREQYGLPREL